MTSEDSYRASRKPLPLIQNMTTIGTIAALPLQTITGDTAGHAAPPVLPGVMLSLESAQVLITNTPTSLK
jgi:hypothetical protein